MGGNHEKYVDAERTFTLVKKYRVNVRRSQVVEIHGLQLVGLDYWILLAGVFGVGDSQHEQMSLVLESFRISAGMMSRLIV